MWNRMIGRGLQGTIGLVLGEIVWDPSWEI